MQEKKSKVSCSDITSPALMMKWKVKKTMNHLIIKQKPAWLPWIRINKYSQSNVEISNMITTIMKLIPALIPQTRKKHVYIMKREKNQLGPKIQTVKKLMR